MRTALDLSGRGAVSLLPLKLEPRPHQPKQGGTSAVETGKLEKS